MSSREDVRATLLTLLLAGKSVKEIVADVQCGRMLVYEIKKRLAKKIQIFLSTSYPK